MSCWFDILELLSIALPAMANRWIKNLFKFLVVLGVLLGTAASVFHHTHALSDAAHHEETCGLCEAYQSLSGGSVPLPLLAFLGFIILIASSHAFRPYRHFTSLDLSLINPGLDPPVTHFN